MRILESEKIIVKMLKTVKPDLSFVFTEDPFVVAEAGKEYNAKSNQFGAVCVVCVGGSLLGVKPGEFEFVEAPEWLLKIHAGIIKKPKFRVECQELVTFEIEAESQEEAESIAGIKIIEKCLYDADSFDWSISAYKI